MTRSGGDEDESGSRNEWRIGRSGAGFHLSPAWIVLEEADEEEVQIR